MTLRTTVTGPTLAVTTALAVLQTIFLSVPRPPFDVPAPVFLFTLAAGVSACVAHLIAVERAHRDARLADVLTLVEARLDSHELLDLDKAIGGVSRLHRAHPRPRRRSNRRGDSNIFDLG